MSVERDEVSLTSLCFMFGSNVTKCEAKLTSLEADAKQTEELQTRLESEFKQLEEDATSVLQTYKNSTVSTVCE